MSHTVFEIKGPVQSGKTTALVGVVREASRASRDRSMLVYPTAEWARLIERKFNLYGVRVVGAGQAAELLDWGRRQFTVIAIDDFERTPDREALFEACKAHLDLSPGPSQLIVASTCAEFERTGRLVPARVRPQPTDGS